MHHGRLLRTTRRMTIRTHRWNLLLPFIYSCCAALLGENTLVVSDALCVAPGPRTDTLRLLCRVADTYPTQFLEVTVSLGLLPGCRS
jgi:hypothetical protein